jgi:hypothetical protein
MQLLARRYTDRVNYVRDRLQKDEVIEGRSKKEGRRSELADFSGNTKARDALGSCSPQSNVQGSYDALSETL